MSGSCEISSPKIGWTEMNGPQHAPQSTLARISLALFFPSSLIPFVSLACSHDDITKLFEVAALKGLRKENTDHMFRGAVLD